MKSVVSGQLPVVGFVPGVSQGHVSDVGVGTLSSVVSSQFSVLSFRSLISYLAQACGFKFFDFDAGDAVAFHLGDGETMAFVIEAFADTGKAL